ncbi:MAG: hypothetical protein L3K15_06825 [Thermoplasmata archaeon]|nr:hypothetical protein [Thermoplasmata archaeon]
MSVAASALGEVDLLGQLAAAIAHAPRPVQGIEVGIGLSIALGKRRPAVTCGGCSTPLEFQGIPAQTNARMAEPFRLILAPPVGA